MDKTKKVFLSAGVLGVMLFLSGCSLTDQLGGKIIEKTIESQTGGKVKIDTDNKAMTIKDENGNSLSMGNSKIPDNFPKDIIVFDDAKVIFVASSGENDFSVIYGTGKNIDETLTKYKEGMVSQGWKKDEEMDLGDAGKILKFSKEKRNLMITIGTDKSGDNPSQTTVSIIGATDKGVTGQPVEGVMNKPNFNSNSTDRGNNIPSDAEVMPKPDFPVQN